jgi:hypothetical protein
MIARTCSKPPPLDRAWIFGAVAMTALPEYKATGRTISRKLHKPGAIGF